MVFNRVQWRYVTSNHTEGNRSMRKIAIALVITSLALAGCNTVRGVGKDLESAANAVDDET